MRIELRDGFYLGPVRDGDQSAYLEHFADKDTADRLLMMPFPYTQEDAQSWVQARINASRTRPMESHFAVRRPDGFLVGGIGLILNGVRGAHRAEIGYWLAREYRNRGLITVAVKTVTQYGFEQLNLTRIEATAFVKNTASQRVLEKAGFACEGVLKGYHRKHGRPIDVCMYARLAPESPESSTMPP
jgi:ribosomal-protein-alanine N-acetyltransferase